MAFMIKRQENKRVQNTLEKSQNYSRYPLTFDDNYIIMANMTNNNDTQEDTKIMFQVVQTIVRGGEWQQDIVAEFATESEAIDFAKRCHNGNPTTRVIKK
jgi:hypothetical protein